MKLENKFNIQLQGMDSIFDATSKLNNESKMHLEECLQVESSNDEIIVEAEQKLHSIQEEAKRLTVKKEEMSKVIFVCNGWVKISFLIMVVLIF